MDPVKVSLGAVFLFVSGAISLQAGLVAPRPPFLIATGASLGLAGLSVLIGGRAGRSRGRRNA